MRVPGYCTQCHKVKQVTVTANALVTAAARRGVVSGVCSACETAAKEKREATKSRQRH